MKSLLCLIKKNRAFTVIEVIVVVSLISILAATVIANMSQSSAVSRDAQRKADLRNVQQALELYRQEHGRYPAGCNGTGWSGQIGTSYACPSGASDYIRGTAVKPFVPKFLSVLPVDPKKGSGDYGYVYRTNTEGTVYKFVARNSVEINNLNDIGDVFEFKACDVVENSDDSYFKNQASPGACPATTLPFVTSVPEGSWCGYGMCNVYSINTSGTAGYQRPAAECAFSNIRNSYAVWGGFVDPSEISGGASEELKVERGTESVVCDMPN